MMERRRFDLGRLEPVVIGGIQWPDRFRLSHGKKTGVCMQRLGTGKSSVGSDVVHSEMMESDFLGHIQISSTSSTCVRHWKWSSGLGRTKVRPIDGVAAAASECV